MSFACSMCVPSVLFDVRYLTTSFQTEVAMNTHVIVAGTFQNVLAIQEGAHGQYRSVSGTSSTSSPMGEY